METRIKQSDSIKSEWSGVCHGCLSGDRNLTLLKTNMELFLYLAGQSQVLSEPEYNCSSTLLCWECTAVLTRIQTFRTNVLNAQYILHGSLYQLNDSKIKSLSALTVSTVQILDTSESVQLFAGNEKTSQVQCDLITTNMLKCEKICPEDSPSDKTKKHDTSLETQKQASAVEAGKPDDKIEDEVKEFDIICKEETSDFDIQNAEFSDTEFPLEHNTKKIKVKKEQKKQIFYPQYSNMAYITVNEIVDDKKFDECCTRVCLSANEMENMIKKINTNRKKLKLKCGQCKMGFQFHVDFHRHKTFIHNPDDKLDGSYECLECLARVSTRDDLLTHWNKHNHVFKCKYCEDMYKYPSEIQNHLRRAHGKVFACRMCQAMFYSGKDLGNHYNYLHRVLICDECGFKCSSKKILIKHLRRHVPVFKCDKCNRTYVNYKSLMHHFGQAHPSVPDNRETAYCVECDKQYDSVYRYKAHLKSAYVHIGKEQKKRIPCPLCGKIFARRTTLNNHYSLYHAGKAKYNCDICGKCLVTQYALKNHRMRVHDKIPLAKTKKCDLCGRTFSTNVMLANHRRTHTGERPFVCELCHAAFTQSTPLVTHMRKQHNLQDFNYKSIKIKSGVKDQQ